MTEIDYRILSSGSKGNAVRIENIMVDAGIAFKHMKEELYKCRYLFYTHRHSDHLNIKTYQAIRKNFPKIIIIGNYEVAQSVPVDIVATTKEIKMKKNSIKPFEVPHDVTCHGFTFEINDNTGIYVTDSAGKDEWPKGEYDYLFIESNHDENKLERINTRDYGYDVFGNAKRHTSTQESKAFYYMNRRDSDSKWIELHKSGRFY